jgi:AcrR family transcriptional regulator
VAYQVTKRIKGRDYRYRVERAGDPGTGRAGLRWTYLGKVEDGVLVAPARSANRRVTHAEIVAVTAKLLEAREASRVTVAVIAHHAGISPGTFYRHFADRESALAAALTALCERCFADLPALDAPLGTREAERGRLSGWFEALQRAVLRGRAFRWFLTTTAHGKLEAALREAAFQADPRVFLADYFRRLDDAGLAHIGQPVDLANAMMRLHASVVRDMALHHASEDAAAEHWAAVFPVIGRAVFG